MVRIELRHMIETDEGFEDGEVAGEIIIDGDKPEVSVEDAPLRLRLQKLLDEGLVALGGDPSGVRMVTTARKVSPGDPHFPSVLAERIEQKDFRLQARTIE